jgi:MoaA/NifB/PqqE/SkfB family radical SAM enzyme
MDNRLLNTIKARCTSSTLRSWTPEYKLFFDPSDGFTARWGKTLKDNPTYSPIGPEILDIEISTICNQGCKFCYKNNTPKGKVMPFETYKAVIDKLPTITQVALGIGDLSGVPELEKILAYTRSKGIVPNITVNGLDCGGRFAIGWAALLAKYCGAVAISLYSAETVYRAAMLLRKTGLKQINIHALMSTNTYEEVFKNLGYLIGSRAIGLVDNVVFLGLKPMGRGSTDTPLSGEKFKILVEKVKASNTGVGFDSCSANRFVRLYPEYKDNPTVEPCESGLFSAYVDVDGLFYPCSFSTEAFTGFRVENCKDFLEDIWYSDEVYSWRNRLLRNCRSCPIHKVEG